jgi:hypothetical protein
MSARARERILSATLRSAFETEVKKLFNPLAIGVTFAGLLLDTVAPRPKPRAGPAQNTLLSSHAVPRTTTEVTGAGGADRQLVAGGVGR